MTGNAALPLSVVATSRNDDHGGSLTRRMQLFVRAWIEQCRRHDLACELVLVEWNPPADRRPLIEEIDWPDDPGPCQVRIVTVSNEHHRRLRHSDRLPLFQYFAKNVGIRRARGRFVLSTNIDLLFTDELFHYLRDGHLEEGHFYRLDRRDVASDVPLEASIPEQLAYCRANQIRINAKNRTFPAGSDGVAPRDPPVVRQVKSLRAMGDFAAHQLRTTPPVELPRPDLSFPALRQRLLTGFDVAHHTVSDYVRGGAPRPDLHYNACGDFTLMATEDWHAIRAHEELELYSWHLDSLLLIKAFHHGLRQIVLEDPIRMYHIEHGGGFTPELARQLFERLEKQGVGFLNEERFRVLGQAIEVLADLKGPLLTLSPENWGMADHDLPESSPY